MDNDWIRNGLVESTWIIESVVDPKSRTERVHFGEKKLLPTVRLDRIILQNALVSLHQESQMVKSSQSQIPVQSDSRLELTKHPDAIFAALECVSTEATPDPF